MKIILFALMIFTGTCFATDISNSSKDEISHLFSYVEKSACQFNRNGYWYQPKDASAHLKSKYEKLLAKKLIFSTEDFVVMAATNSNLTGKPYLVQCSNSVITESSIWFNAELARYRKSKK